MFREFFLLPGSRHASDLQIRSNASASACPWSPWGVEPRSGARGDLAFAKAHSLAAGGVSFWLGDNQVLPGDPVRKTGQDGWPDTEATIAVGDALRKDVIVQHGSVQAGFVALGASGKICTDEFMRWVGRESLSKYCSLLTQAACVLGRLYIYICGVV